jgi:hypothetical protein
MMQTKLSGHCGSRLDEECKRSYSGRVVSGPGIKSETGRIRSSSADISPAIYGLKNSYEGLANPENVKATETTWTVTSRYPQLGRMPRDFRP